MQPAIDRKSPNLARKRTIFFLFLPKIAEDFSLQSEFTPKRSSDRYFGCSLGEGKSISILGDYLRFFWIFYCRRSAASVLIIIEINARMTICEFSQMWLDTNS